MLPTTSEGHSTLCITEFVGAEHLPSVPQLCPNTYPMRSDNAKWLWWDCAVIERRVGLLSDTSRHAMPEIFLDKAVKGFVFVRRLRALPSVRIPG